MIEIGLTFKDTDTQQEVSVPLRDFEAKPLTAAKFDKLILAYYEIAGADGTPGENRMADLELIAGTTYKEFRRVFHRWATHHADVEDFET
jgi:hypothetical protein